LTNRREIGRFLEKQGARHQEREEQNEEKQTKEDQNWCYCCSEFDCQKEKRKKKKKTRRKGGKRKEWRESNDAWLPNETIADQSQREEDRVRRRETQHNRKKTRRITERDLTSGDKERNRNRERKERV
jgi:hypothetical protein